jgi:hypothetical protein
MSDDTPSVLPADSQAAVDDAPRFKLLGSLESDLTAEEIGDWIDENRRHQAALAQAKFTDL